MTNIFRPNSVRCFFLIPLVTLLSSCSQAQEIGLEPVNIPLSAQANRKADVTYTHQKLKDGQGKKAKLTALLEIKSNTDDGFSASWITKSVEVGGVVIDYNSPQAAGMLLGVPLEFLTGADGGPVKLLDKETLFEELPNSAAFAKTDTKTVDQVINFFKSMDDDTIANVFFKVPSFMSVCQDTSFIVGEINNYPTEQASPFGEGVLAGNVSYELTSVDLKRNKAYIEYRSEFNKDSVKQLAIQSIKKLAPDTPPSQKDIDELVMDRQDSADCEVDMSTGWVTKMKYSTMMSASGQVNEEIFDISLNWIE